MPTKPHQFRPLFQNEAARLTGDHARNTRGMTILELMIGSVLFLAMSMGVFSALIQSHKMAEDNVAQATAAVIAQGIIEQVQLNPYVDITDQTNASSQANYDNLQLKFTGANSTTNLASIQQSSVPWAADTTTFTKVGALKDPNDLASVQGILIDLEYRDGSTVIRAARYMPMEVNIIRIIHNNEHNVEVVLTYRWLPPSRITSNTYFTRTLRTVRSEAPSY